MNFSNANSTNDLINSALNLIDKNKPNEALDLLMERDDDINVQFYIGAIYNEMLTDYDNAIKWFELCGSQGQVDCQYYAYFIYSEIFEDLKQSHYWLELCADNQDAYCLNDLGHRYDNGIYVKQNKKLAYQWFLKAAEKDLSNSYTSIGSYYLDGEVVNQSFSKAFNFYERGAASNLGNPERAIYGLGLMYEKGLGTKVDYSQAKKLYLEANGLGHELSLLRIDAIEGSAEAALLLAGKYKNGSDIDLGLPIDYEESAFFYKIAEFKGRGDPREFDELIKIMKNGGFEREWDKAAERFEIWKSNVGFTEKDTLNDISEYFLSHTGTASYINSNFLVTNKHITHIDDKFTKKCDKLVGFDPYSGKYEEYQVYNTDYLPKSLDVDLIYNPKGTDFGEIQLSINNPRLGETVIAIGFPQGDRLSKYPKITSGLVSSDFGSSNEPDEFMIDATSYGGSSGSPIFNINNQLIGILWGGPVMSLSSANDEWINDPNIAYVVKSKYLNSLLEYNEISLNNEISDERFETFEIAEKNIKRIRFIECYQK